MKISDKAILRGSILSPVMLVLAVGLAGCGGPIVFEGQSATAIGGDLPPPPPPPPPPKPEPPKPPPRVELKEDKIQINEKVQFEYNASKIKPDSFSLLQEVAKVIKDHPSLKKIRVEGHASSEGNDDYNMKLSDARAKAVRDYLIKEGGVAADRLEAKGYGETKPIASNDTEQGKEQNRRVEFNIVEQDSAARKAEAAAAPPAETPAATPAAEPKKEPAADPKKDSKKEPAADPKKDSKKEPAAADPKKDSKKEPAAGDPKKDKPAAGDPKKDKPPAGDPPKKDKKEPAATPAAPK